ncbi:hypothetical protein X777_01089 [Ooceraea biroi]|uniref:Uncharacterized protein n=1 Tax=Ooceraea biroi TaxID=2015173 RepID=A0A026VVK6_OOCBI|nr:hypothetical protein X777_01089 [Ooceraea biroi]
MATHHNFYTGHPDGTQPAARLRVAPFSREPSKRARVPND